MMQQTTPRLIPSAAHVAQPQQMQLADNLSISPDLLIGAGLAAFGVPGAGKTNFGALLLEQFGKFYIPMAIFDLEHEYGSLTSVLPRSIVATPENCPSGADILDYGLQVVFDLQAWDDPEAQAQLICSVISEMMSWADSRASHERVPALIFADEASYWLPERTGDYLSRDTFKALRTTFGQLGSRGRKRGLTPILLNQRISTLSKAALGYIQAYILMKQSLDVDLERYLEYIHSDLTARQVKARIAKFGRGKAMVVLPDGRQVSTIFHERKSEHVSHTPTVQAALNKYAALPALDASITFSAPRPGAGETEAPVPAAQKKTATRRHQSQSTKKKQPKATSATRKKAQARKLLQADPALAAQLHIHPNTARIWKRELTSATL